jgi:uracil-DNA glycosylase
VNTAKPEFEQLLARVRACTACAGLPLGPRPILQAGPQARILVAGQAPGRITHERGRPFDDASGVRLREWLGVDESTFYDPTRFALVPMGFCYPGTGAGGDLPPRLECAALWRERLLAVLPDIRLTVVLGLHAQRWHLGERCGKRLTDTVADWRQHWPDLLPLPHPSPRNIAWLKRRPHVERDILPALRERVAGLLS